MCLFNFPNRTSPKARAKGMTHFECGGCPECMQKKSRLWALRCSMEAKVNIGMMVTLTYDTYKYSTQNGVHSYEENPINPDIPLSKDDCQKFIKRLRKHFTGKKIKYLLTAERGSRGRAHYHALIFGVRFDDLVRYKKSKRGNIIYKSQTLEKIWKNGICTVDCINLSAKTARYCTKYCSKDSGAKETFMLFSRGIGDTMLKKLFNGKSYWIDGREYSIPKQIWQWYIERKYDMAGYSRYIPHHSFKTLAKSLYNKLNNLEKLCQYRDFTADYIYDKLREKYENISALKLIFDEKHYQRGKERNLLYQETRDKDIVYQNYLKYWNAKAKYYELRRAPAEERIQALPDSKYARYKAYAIQAKICEDLGCSFVPPRSNCHGFDRNYKKPEPDRSFAPLSRHYRANDTKNTPSGRFWYKQCLQSRINSQLKECNNDLIKNPFLYDFKDTTVLPVFKPNRCPPFGKFNISTKKFVKMY